MGLKEYIENKKGKIFIKKTNGECGDGVYLIEHNGGKCTINKRDIDLSEIGQRLGESEYIIQDAIEQHHVLNAINSSCVNTIRIVTIVDKDKQPHIFAKVLRIGTGEKINDNASTGGFYVNITDDGILEERGYAHLTSITEHPNTHIRFKGIEIPYWKETIAMVSEIHSWLPAIKSIGWDVAITENGPCLIEGNDNWEISLHQDVEGGLKERWNQMMYKM